MGILSLFLAASLSGPWTGTYSLGGSAQVAFDISGKRAAVALGVGHAGLQSVPVSTAKGKVTFRLPGAPSPIVFSGRLTRSRIRGTVRQGTARGTFQVRRGRAPSLVAPGIYAGGGRTLAVVDDPYGPARLVDLDTGELHGLYPSGGGFVRRLRMGDPCANQRHGAFRRELSRHRRQLLRSAPVSPVGGALPQRRRHPLGNADGAAGRRTAPGGGVGARLRTDGAGLSPRPGGSPPPPRHRRSRLRQARNRSVRRQLSRRVAVSAHDRRRSPAMPKPPFASSARDPRSTTTASASPATARPDGSSHSRRRASPQFASPSSSPGRPSRRTRTTITRP